MEEKENKMLQQIVQLLQDNGKEVECLKKAVNDMAKSNVLVTHKVEEVLNKTSTHERILRGDNGNPGCLSAQKRMIEMLEEDHKLLHGDEDTPGISQKVDAMHKFYLGSGKFVWLVLGAAVPIILKLIFTGVP